MRKAYQYRFYPTPEQAQLLARTFGCTRFVYNWALAMRRDAYQKEGKRLSYGDTSAALTALKRQPETAWLNEVSSVPLQQALRHLQTAFGNFFAKRAKYPTFKKKRGRQSAEFTRSAFTWIGQNLTLAKMKEPLNIVWSRPLGGVPSTVTVSRDPAGRYFVSILVAEEIQPLPPVEQTVGVDMGLTHAVILSTGEKIDNPRFLARHEKRLAKAQRNLARKQKGSRNREKARRKVARIHAQIADCRCDFTHKLTTHLIRENQVICVESLAVKNMVRNRSLAKAISDVGWGEIVRQLRYKAEWYGRTVVEIDRWFPSSKVCSACGCVVDDLPLSVREWDCPGCGTHHDRDHNAAVNIEREGLRQTA